MNTVTNTVTPNNTVQPFEQALRQKLTTYAEQNNITRISDPVVAMVLIHEPAVQNFLSQNGINTEYLTALLRTSHRAQAQRDADEEKRDKAYRDRFPTNETVLPTPQAKQEITFDWGYNHFEEGAMLNSVGVAPSEHALTFFKEFVHQNSHNEAFSLSGVNKIPEIKTYLQEKTDRVAGIYNSPAQQQVEALTAQMANLTTALQGLLGTQQQQAPNREVVGDHTGKFSQSNNSPLSFVRGDGGGHRTAA